MTLIAFAFILASVFLHAGWNFISKASKPSISFYAVFCLAAAVVLIPFFPFADMTSAAIDCRFWAYFAVSVLFEVIYAIGLSYGYRMGDISTVYPISRALPVLFIPLVVQIIGTSAPPTPLALAGIGTVAAGCFLLPQPSLAKLSWKCLLTPAMLPILTAAIGTTGYTFADSMATAQMLGNAPATRIPSLAVYLFLIQLAMGIVLLLIALLTPVDSFATLKACFTSPWPHVSGIFSSFAYLLVLVAMGFVSNVSYLQAFRQMSLPMGVFAGIYFLKERFTLPKAIGTLLIVVGLILTVI